MCLIPKPAGHIHLVGICGTAMGNVAVALKEKGYRVTGSDQNIYPPMSDVLTEHGITAAPFHAGHVNEADLSSLEMRFLVVIRRLRLS